MRPPHYAGENTELTHQSARASIASMRPPHYAGENVALAEGVAGVRGASMRPPHYAGENAGGLSNGSPAPGCFNEAPALRGGKHATKSASWPSSNSLQ